MGAAAVGFGGQWLERAIKAGSLHNEDHYVKARVRGAEKAQGLQILFCKLYAFSAAFNKWRLYQKRRILRVPQDRLRGSGHEERAEVTQPTKPVADSVGGRGSRSAWLLPQAAKAPALRAAARLSRRSFSEGGRKTVL
jgi:hypothetical protein